jgi:hypothetical protein
VAAIGGGSADVVNRGEWGQVVVEDGIEVAGGADEGRSSAGRRWVVAAQEPTAMRDRVMRRLGSRVMTAATLAMEMTR